MTLRQAQGERLKLFLSSSAIAATADLIDEAYPGVELYEVRPMGLAARFIRVLGATETPS